MCINIFKKIHIVITAMHLKTLENIFDSFMKDYFMTSCILWHIYDMQIVNIRFKKK